MTILILVSLLLMFQFKKQNIQGIDDASPVVIFFIFFTFNSLYTIVQKLFSITKYNSKDDNYFFRKFNERIRQT